MGYRSGGSTVLSSRGTVRSIWYPTYGGWWVSGPSRSWSNSIRRPLFAIADRESRWRTIVMRESPEVLPGPSAAGHSQCRNRPALPVALHSETSSRSDHPEGSRMTQTATTTTARTASNVTKRVYIKTYGCQMNIYDSGRMAEVLAPLGFIVAETAKDAEKVYSELGTIRRLKAAKAARGSRMIVAVAGCVAQAQGTEMMQRAPCVDLVI